MVPKKLMGTTFILCVNVQSNQNSHKIKMMGFGRHARYARRYTGYTLENLKIDVWAVEKNIDEQILHCWVKLFLQD